MCGAQSLHRSGGTRMLHRETAYLCDKDQECIICQGQRPGQASSRHMHMAHSALPAAGWGLLLTRLQ